MLNYVGVLQSLLLEVIGISCDSNAVDWPLIFDCTCLCLFHSLPLYLLLYNIGDGKRFTVNFYHALKLMDFSLVYLMMKWFLIS